jgi:hypothetical protein
MGCENNNEKEKKRRKKNKTQRKVWRASGSQQRGKGTAPSYGCAQRCVDTRSIRGENGGGKKGGKKLGVDENNTGKHKTHTKHTQNTHKTHEPWWKWNKRSSSHTDVKWLLRIWGREWEEGREGEWASEHDEKGKKKRKGNSKKSK